VCPFSFVASVASARTLTDCIGTCLPLAIAALREFHTAARGFPDPAPIIGEA
jgi:hypothetical protein